MDDQDNRTAGEEAELSLWIANALEKDEVISESAMKNISTLLSEKIKESKQQQMEAYGQRQLNLLEQRDEMHKEIKSLNEKIKGFLDRALGNEETEDGKCVSEETQSIKSPAAVDLVEGNNSTYSDDNQNAKGQDETGQVSGKPLETITEEKEQKSVKHKRNGFQKYEDEDSNTTAELSKEEMEVEQDAQEQKYFQDDKDGGDHEPSSLHSELVILKTLLQQLSTPLQEHLKQHHEFAEMMENCHEMLLTYSKDDQDLPVDDLLENALQEAEETVKRLQDEAFKRFRLNYSFTKRVREVQEQYEEKIEIKEQEVEEIKIQTEVKEEVIQKLEEIVEPEKKKERKDTQANRNDMQSASEKCSPHTAKHTEINATKTRPEDKQQSHNVAKIPNKQAVKQDKVEQKTQQKKISDDSGSSQVRNDSQNPLVKFDGGKETRKESSTTKEEKRVAPRKTVSDALQNKDAKMPERNSEETDPVTKCKEKQTTSFDEVRQGERMEHLSTRQEVCNDSEDAKNEASAPEGSLCQEKAKVAQSKPKYTSASSKPEKSTASNASKHSRGLAAVPEVTEEKFTSHKVAQSGSTKCSADAQDQVQIQTSSSKKDTSHTKIPAEDQGQLQKSTTAQAGQEEYKGKFTSFGADFLWTTPANDKPEGDVSTKEKTTTTTSHHTDSTESDQDLQISHPRFGFNKHGEKVFINKCGDEIVYQEVQQGLPSASGKIVKLSDLRAKGQNAESKAWKVAGPRD